jgi:hypothetical protein
MHARTTVDNPDTTGHATTHRHPRQRHHNKPSRDPAAPRQLHGQSRQPRTLPATISRVTITHRSTAPVNRRVVVRCRRPPALVTCRRALGGGGGGGRGQWLLLLLRHKVIRHLGMIIRIVASRVPRQEAVADPCGAHIWYVSA